MTITISAGDLQKVVKTVAPFAATPRANLPILETVEFRVIGGELVATATDRFRLAMLRIAGEVSDSFDPLVMRVADLKTLAPTVGAGHCPVSLTRDAAAIHVRSGVAALEFSIATGEFPNVQRLIANVLDGIASSPADTTRSFDATQLADYKKVTAALKIGKDQPVVTVPGGLSNKPVAVTIGDRWFGLLMPTLRDVTVDELGPWRSLLTTTTVAA